MVAQASERLRFDAKRLTLHSLSYIILYDDTMRYYIAQCYASLDYTMRCCTILYYTVLYVTISCSTLTQLDPTLLYRITLYYYMLSLLNVAQLKVALAWCKVRPVLR